MRALVVFESMFGNTETIARAVAEGLAGSMGVEVVEVGAAPTAIAGDVDVLVVGGPTHALGMSRASTREEAAKQSEHGLVSAGIGVREWLEAVERSARVPAAAFDTRVAKPRVPGSAAKAAARRLRRLGFPEAARAESFWVGGTPGPLLEGEVERARRWGEGLAAAVAETSRGREAART